jgi:hypothetical protein
MKLVQESGVFFLDASGQRVSLSTEELKLFKLMTPLGRKVTLRKRAVDKMAQDPSDPESRLILDLFRLPARDWSFWVP